MPNGRPKVAVISTRVCDRVKRLIQAAAEGKGQTVSRFIAEAAEQSARVDLLGDERCLEQGIGAGSEDSPSDGATGKATANRS